MTDIINHWLVGLLRQIYGDVYSMLSVREFPEQIKQQTMEMMY